MRELSLSTVHEYECVHAACGCLCTGKLGGFVLVLTAADVGSSKQWLVRAYR
jgi:hypothetical protein